MSGARSPAHVAQLAPKNMVFMEKDPNILGIPIPRTKTTDSTEDPKRWEPIEVSKSETINSIRSNKSVKGKISNFIKKITNKQ